MPVKAPAITELAHDITAIDVDYARPMLASSHLLRSGDRAAFVDTGTALSVPLLLRTLADKDIAPESVDLVILTHIHLDHAGGAGPLMKALPVAKLVVHPRGARHIVSPERLVQGSIAVYGEAKFRELYGEVTPVDADRVIETGDGQEFRFGDRTFEFLHTEGHAKHHHCIADSRSGGIFTGDSFGISYRELDTRSGEFIFPTTTPVHFDPDAAHATIDRLLARQPKRLYLTHFSEVRDLARLGSDMHLCLDRFVALAKEHAGRPNAKQSLTDALFNFLSERLDDHGFAQDVERRHAILDMDCDLNAQGLLHWAEHTEQ